MGNPERYPFLSGNPALGEASFRPDLPLTLVYQESFPPPRMAPPPVPPR